MIVFLTTVRHPVNSNNFEKVELLLNLTARSVLNQTDPDFRFVIVCNEIPDISVEDPRIVYHVVDSPPPLHFGKSIHKADGFQQGQGNEAHVRHLIFQSVRSGLHLHH